MVSQPVGFGFVFESLLHAGSHAMIPDVAKPVRNERRSIIRLSPRYRSTVVFGESHKLFHRCKPFGKTGSCVHHLTEVGTGLPRLALPSSTYVRTRRERPSVNDQVWPCVCAGIGFAHRRAGGSK